MKRELVLKTFNNNKAELLKCIKDRNKKYETTCVPFIVTAELTVENCSVYDESDLTFFFVDAIFDNKSNKFIRLEWNNIYEGIPVKDIEYYNIEL